MTSNSKNDIKVVPYKEVVKKSVRLLLRKQRSNNGKEIDIESCRLKKKRKDMSLIDNGMIGNHLKKGRNETKAKRILKKQI